MKTTYVPHLFGDAAQAKLTTRQAWLTAGVVSSIAGPAGRRWVLYDIYPKSDLPKFGAFRSRPVLNPQSSERLKLFLCH